MKTVNFREVPLSEIINLPVYPVADILPKLEKSSKNREDGKTKTLTLSELADSIIEHGQHEAIVLYLGQILDGRNRRWACEMAAKATGTPLEEFTVLVEDFEGTEDEATEFVFTAGLDRRDLEPTQRAMSAAKFEYEPATRPMFERMKEKANIARIEGNRRGAEATNDGAVVSTNVDDRVEVVGLLSQRFRVAKSYIYDARRILKDEQAARDAAERAAERAEEYELQAELAKAEVEQAKATGDMDKVRENATIVNNATQHKAEEREKSAELSNKAADLGRLADSLHEGRKNLSEVRKERKEDGKDERELAISKAATDFNNAFSKIVTAGRFLLDFGRPNDQENVRRKFIRICEEFGDLEEFEGITSSEDVSAYWDEVEAESAEHGFRSINSQGVDVAHTKPCGCDFSGSQTCSACL